MLGRSMLLKQFAKYSSSQELVVQPEISKFLSPYSSRLLKFERCSSYEKSLIRFLSAMSFSNLVIQLKAASKYNILLNEISSSSRFTSGLKTQTETKLQNCKFKCVSFFKQYNSDILMSELHERSKVCKLIRGFKALKCLVLQLRKTNFMRPTKSFKGVMSIYLFELIVNSLRFTSKRIESIVYNQQLQWWALEMLF
ncbi:Hypothetical_protein [Hexamita inflata]|uniref:Hypothetical_protein n=1 Tax=Hexamita inflata TaxID=28002 RepID=A0AA86UPA0_9EUKA|nr:Hypothetical protein HINF_LOCUS50519 [Hexamita inflata]